MTKKRNYIVKCINPTFQSNLLERMEYTIPGYTDGKETSFFESLESVVLLLILDSE